MLISKQNSVLVVIDVQEAINPVMMEPRKVIKYSTNLVKIANELNIPHIITEQVPEKLGQTIIDIREQTIMQNVVAKSAFSCCKEATFMEKLHASQKKQVIITGIESHVCVMQTAFDLKERGFEVFVVADAISSRKKLDFDTACNRMRDGGIHIVTYEMVVFELLQDAKSPEFKTISKSFIDRN